MHVQILPRNLRHNIELNNLSREENGGKVVRHAEEVQKLADDVQIVSREKSCKKCDSRSETHVNIFQPDSQRRHQSFELLLGSISIFR